MYRSRSVVLWLSCIITRLNCRSSVSVTSGTRPTIPSACFSASVKAVDLLSDGSWSNSIPYLLVVIFLFPFIIVFPSCQNFPSVLVLTCFDLAGNRHIGMDHLCRVDDAVEFFCRYKSQLECGFLKSEIVVQRVMGDLRSFVIADDRRKCGYQHQRAADIFFDLLQIGLRSFN